MRAALAARRFRTQAPAWPHSCRLFPGRSALPSRGANLATTSDCDLGQTGAPRPSPRQRSTRARRRRGRGRPAAGSDRQPRAHPAPPGAALTSLPRRRVGPREAVAEARPRFPGRRRSLPARPGARVGGPRGCNGGWRRLRAALTPGPARRSPPARPAPSSPPQPAPLAPSPAPAPGPRRGTRRRAPRRQWTSTLEPEEAVGWRPPRDRSSRRRRRVET